MKFRERYKFDSSKDFIGKGGFARVYKAKDTVRNRVVALKFYQGMESGKYDIISEINPLIKINDLSIASSKSDSLDLELRKNGIENAIKKYPQNLTIIISIVK